MGLSTLYRVRLISAFRSLGSLGYRRGLAVSVTVAVLLATELVGIGVVEAKGTTKPPPIPTCYYTGSGYGDCEGYVIPGGGSVVPLTVANKTDEFKLQGPAPLQWTKPVACGDLGCVYNHLDWFVAPGVTVVKGCKTNVSFCWVIVDPGTRAWVPVYVRQNNDSPTIYLIFNSGTPLKKGGHLQMSVTSSAASGSLEVNKTATIFVKLTAVGGVIHSIVPSTLTLSSASLTTPNVTPPSGFSLAKGTSRVLSYTVTGASEGTATVTASAQGIDAVGRSTPASGALSFQVGTKNIAIRVVTTPYTVELKVDDHGKVLTEQIEVRSHPHEHHGDTGEGCATPVAAPGTRSTRRNNSTSSPSPRKPSRCPSGISRRSRPRPRLSTSTSPVTGSTRSRH